MEEPLVLLSSEDGTDTDDNRVVGTGGAYQDNAWTGERGDSSDLMVEYDREDQSKNPETAENSSSRIQGSEGNDRLDSDQDERQDLAQGNANEPEGVNEDRSGLRYDAKSSFLQIFPASVCFLVAVATLSFVTNYTSNHETTYLVISSFRENFPAEPVTPFALYVVVGIGWYLLLTILMVLLCKYRCFMIILGLGYSLYLLYTNYVFFKELFAFYNMAIDYFTVVLLNWNICTVGLVCLLWKGPLRLQLMYLIWISTLMAFNLLNYFQESPLWATLSAISLFDIFAVACPENLLKKFTYFPTMTWAVRMALCDKNNDTTAAEIQLPQRISDGHGNSQADAAVELSVDGVENGDRARGLHQPQAPNERGAKLRLGDFIVYGLLAGRVSSNGDWNITVACFVAILIGLCLALFLSAIYRKPLPALPISLVLGVAFNFATKKLIKPYADVLASEQIFI